MGHGASGMGHRAWGIGHGAWGNPPDPGLFHSHQKQVFVGGSAPVPTPSTDDGISVSNIRAATGAAHTRV
ncbi:MAG: hypothetical protein EAZ09_22965 [Oscillatoriales cyanobacterium]|nr:MAG: hypothetical protein EAZ18_12775 [Oscillatoriales cyanobacterium]TAH15903.1 MAG: hypothetical protein EAZ09_22965 [Oscillatoriales cyanobacterium]